MEQSAKQNNRRTTIIAAAAALCGVFVGLTLPASAQLGEVLKGAAIGVLVSQFGGQIDARQRILCDNIKAQGVTIYSIQLNTGSPGESRETCLRAVLSGHSETG